MTLQDRLSEIEKKNLHPFDGAIISRDIPKLVKALRVAVKNLSAIQSAKISGCVDYKGCECWHQFATEALTEIERILNAEGE